MRSEFNLVSAASSERSILLQAAAILVTLAFVVYVGTTGGITDGSERFGGMEDVGGFIDEFRVSGAGDVVGGEGTPTEGDGTPWI